MYIYGLYCFYTVSIGLQTESSVLVRINVSSCSRYIISSFASIINRHCPTSRQQIEVVEFWRRWIYRTWKMTDLKGCKQRQVLEKVAIVMSDWRWVKFSRSRQRRDAATPDQATLQTLHYDWPNSFGCKQLDLVLVQWLTMFVFRLLRGYSFACHVKMTAERFVWHYKHCSLIDW